MKVIAVDLDETLAHTLEKLIEWHNDRFGTQFSVTDFNTNDYWKIWGGTREESCMKIREFYDSPYFEQIQPIQDFALETLKMLKRRHFTLVVVTSRQQFIADKTKKFIDKHYPGIFDSIYFCNLNLSDREQQEYISKPKSLICKEIGVDVLIDDSLIHAQDCVKLGIDILLYDKDGNYSWNKCLDDNNIHRMTSWKQIHAQFPKPSSPLKHCHTFDEQEEDEPTTTTFYTYETIEVEAFSDEEEQELVWKDNRVYV